jgi:carboxyl-terminal processing protease
MRFLVGAALLLLTACVADGSGEGTVSDTDAVGTTAGPTTTMATTTTSRPEPIPVEIEDCATPQIWFSPLCQAYDLAQKWHMDRPIDPNALAQAALDGLRAFSTDRTETSPRTLICAIPDPAFRPLCEELAERASISSIPIGEAVEAAVTSMASTGLEQFSYYVPPGLVGSYRSNGVVGGIGVLLDATDAAGSKCVRIAETCPLEIVFVLEDNPGAEAGLEPGDQIVEVDGEPVSGLGFVDTATRLAGDETGVVEISVERDDTSIDFSIVRAPLVVPTVEIDVPRPGVGYILIPDFEQDIPGLVHDALADLVDEPIDRLVVDLRDNPGGFLDATLDVATEFMSGGVVVQTVGPGEDFSYEAGSGGLASETEITVLVNEGTASAAEILATALRDRRGAMILGEATFGKNAVQIAFNMNNGGEFNVAVARWFSPNGTSVAGTGVVPDRVIELPRSMATVELADIAFEGP